MPDDKHSEKADKFSLNFNLLYSVYSFPNTVLPFFGGILSDRLGVRLMSVIFAGIITVGQAIFALGLTLSDEATSWYVMFVGRTVFGLGGESLSVAMSAMIAQWFAGKELALALGMNLALARVGSVINDVTSEAIAEAFPIYWALWAGLLVCVASFLATVWAFYIDRRAVATLSANRDRLRDQRRAARASKYQSPAFVPAAATPEMVPRLAMSDMHGPAAASTTKGAELGYAESPAMLRRNGEAAAHTTILADADSDEDLNAADVDHVDFKAVLRFPAVFWVLTLSCLSVYCTVLPFNNVASGFIASKWLLPEAGNPPPGPKQDAVFAHANQIMLATYLTAGLLSPFVGGLIDRIGQRAVLNVFASACIVGVHAALGFTYWDPLFPLIVLGLCYSIYASALWPSIALVIPEAEQGTAYGVVTAVQNAGLALAPLIISQLQPGSCNGTYECMELFFMSLGVVGTVAGICLNIVDLGLAVPILNATESQASAMKAAIDAGTINKDADGTTGWARACTRCRRGARRAHHRFVLCDSPPTEGESQALLQHATPPVGQASVNVPV